MGKFAWAITARYLKIFSEAGYIEKTTRLFKKKNLYIRVTDKLMSLIGGQIKPAGNMAGQGEPTAIQAIDTVNTPCIFSEHVGVTGPANLAVSIYKLTFRITKYRNIDYRQTLKKAGKIKIKSGNYRYQSA